MTLTGGAPEEIWLPVVGYEGLYEVSDLGRVKRVAGGRGSVPGRILRTNPEGSGARLQVCLYKPGRGARTTAVHIVVAAAFHGPAPAGHECNHRDGDYRNNRAANLEWTTRLENIRHAYRHGLKTGLAGEHAPSAKLTREQVAEIRSLAGTASSRKLAAQFNVSASTISRVISGRGWAAATGGPVERDILLERRLTVDAAVAAGVDATGLIAFAEQRSGDTPVRNMAVRDFAREMLEELADARNYGIWMACQVATLHAGRANADDIQGAIQRVLALVAQAYEQAERAQRLAERAAELPPTEPAC